MTARRLLILLLLAVFSLCIASPGLSGVAGEEVRGTVTKIDGSNVTIEGFMGDERTIEPKNTEALTGLKLGDRVSVKKGILIKEGGAGPPASSTSPK